MVIFQTVLILATFLCSLTAGFLFAFAVVAMPGIGKLNDRSFIRAFQVMDRIIQNNQPLFMVVWLGSVLALIGAVSLGFRQVDGSGLFLLLAALLNYMLGVQLPTAIINIPLNNRIQAVSVDELDDAGAKAARNAFESRWNRWNVFRTIFACLTSAILMFQLCRL